MQMQKPSEYVVSCLVSEVSVSTLILETGFGEDVQKSTLFCVIVAQGPGTLTLYPGFFVNVFPLPPEVAEIPRETYTYLILLSVKSNQKLSNRSVRVEVNCTIAHRLCLNTKFISIYEKYTLQFHSRKSPDILFSSEKKTNF